MSKKRKRPPEPAPAPAEVALIENAVIKGTFLGVSDDGLMTCILQLQGGQWTQGYGGFPLDGPGPKLDLVTEARRLLEVLGARTWEQITGQVIRVRRMGPTFQSDIHSIGHVINDRWFAWAAKPIPTEATTESA